jgi:hypothetical protein
MDIAISKAGIPIRLTDERWYHIVESHDEVAGYYDEVLITVEDPDFILRGYGGALAAVRSLGRRKYIKSQLAKMGSLSRRTSLRRSHGAL